MRRFLLHHFAASRLTFASLVPQRGCLVEQRAATRPTTFATRRGFRPSLSFLFSHDLFALRLGLPVGVTTKASSVAEEPEAIQGAAVLACHIRPRSHREEERKNKDGACDSRLGC